MPNFEFTEGYEPVDSGAFSYASGKQPEIEEIISSEAYADIFPHAGREDPEELVGPIEDLQAFFYGKDQIDARTALDIQREGAHIILPERARAIMDVYSEKGNIGRVRTRLMTDIEGEIIDIDRVSASGNVKIRPITPEIQELDQAIADIYDQQQGEIELRLLGSERRIIREITRRNRERAAQLKPFTDRLRAAESEMGEFLTEQHRGKLLFAGILPKDRISRVRLNVRVTG